MVFQEVVPWVGAGTVRVHQRVCTWPMCEGPKDSAKVSKRMTKRSVDGDVRGVGGDQAGIHPTRYVEVEEG